MSTEPIRTKQELADAAVRAFLDGDDATRQHIVDELGARAQPKPRDSDDPDALDWTSP